MPRARPEASIVREQAALNAGDAVPAAKASESSVTAGVGARHRFLSFLQLKTVTRYMKVLMFGWEFPPHISGGLGTACYGLTQALLKTKVKIFFVVPRLFGSDSENEDFLINASAITHSLKRKGHSSSSGSRRSLNKRPAAGKYESVEGYSTTFIEVPADIAPYHPSERKLATNRQPSLRSWNYSIRQEHKASGTNNAECANMEDRTTTENDTDELFAFTGTYGDNLMNEVERYADVAGAVAAKYTFDIIHAHDWMTFPAGIQAKKQSNKPLVVHVHSTEFDRSGNNINQTVFEIERTGFQEADRIIAVSNWTKQILVTKYNIPQEKITVVHNGILPKEQPEAYNFPDIGSHFVTFLGRVTHQKGPWFFVEAAQKVLQEFPDAHFILAGAGDLLPQTIERVAQLNMSANFHFTGFLSPSQVDQIWSLTDVYVMPSVSEPFGIAPLEAIQGGVPVILSKQSGVSEVMPHAIKVDFWDVRALAASICSVLRYESLSQVLRHNSKKHIEHLTWDKAAKDVKGVYHELTRKK